MNLNEALTPDKKVESDCHVRHLGMIKEKGGCDICVPPNIKTLPDAQKTSLDQLDKGKSICKVCADPIAFAKPSLLRSHYRKIHPAYESSKGLKVLGSRNKKTVKKNHQKICEICHYECISKSALEKHLLTHTKERPHKCTECQKCFVQSSHVNYHMKTVHAVPGTERPKHHVCMECGSRFSTNSTLRKHIRTHTGKICFLQLTNNGFCIIIYDVGTSRTNIMLNYIMFSGDRPHVCNVCGKGFIQKVHLRNHELKHTGERPYLCVKCGRSFLTSSNFKEHTKLHHPPTSSLSSSPTSDPSVAKVSYSCKVTEGCDAKYMNMADLKIHERIHTGM